MGLIISFTPEDVGLETSLVADFMDEEVEVFVDYSEALEAFCETFMNVALQLVPVDTGYLRSSIDAFVDGDMAVAQAEAHYAQYVEYGTWKMEAQPFFTPAVEEAFNVFMAEAQIAMSEAQEELENELQAILDASMESMEGETGSSFMDFLIGLIVAIIVVAMLSPLLMLEYALRDSLSGDTVSPIDFIEIT